MISTIRSKDSSVPSPKHKTSKQLDLDVYKVTMSAWFNCSVKLDIPMFKPTAVMHELR